MEEPNAIRGYRLFFKLNKLIFHELFIIQIYKIGNMFKMFLQCIDYRLKSTRLLLKKNFKQGVSRKFGEQFESRYKLYTQYIITHKSYLIYVFYTCKTIVFLEMLYCVDNKNGIKITILSINVSYNDNNYFLTSLTLGLLQMAQHRLH